MGRDSMTRMDGRINYDIAMIKDFLNNSAVLLQQ